MYREELRQILWFYQYHLASGAMKGFFGVKDISALILRWYCKLKHIPTISSAESVVRVP